MFLKNLRIRINNTVIRDVSFHKGLNLIVDETKTEHRKESGNNVGKTTVLRLIDFCFGGDGTNIFKDPEFKDRSNTAVEVFLKNNNVIIEMTLKDDLEISSSREITIKRNFLQRSEKILEIDGEPMSAKIFSSNLKLLIFDSSEEKPKLRQIIAKNIRDERNRLMNTLKVLHQCTTSEEYESLFLFWLGVDLDTSSRKQQLLRDKKSEDNLIRRLKQETSRSQIEQSMIVIDRTINELTAQKNSFDVNADYATDLQVLNDIKRLMNQLSTTVGNLELRRELILESKEELEGETSKVDGQAIAALYKEAASLIPDIQKTFEDTITFHNAMRQKRVEYITKELPELEADLATKKRDLAELIVSEKELSDNLQKTEVVEKLQKIISELNQAYETKGSLEEQKRLWDESESKLNRIHEELNRIDAGIESKDDLIQERIAEFNRYFARISSRLYGEQFVLSSVKSERGYSLQISSLSGNLGTGKKKGQIAAFDLAYIQFADANGIPCLHFILQDQMENVHDNQISNLLTEIVAGVNCQYVMPVLRDKLPADVDVSKFEVLTLSQSDKLFKIP
ncbi:MAG: DUF2326 domain-containing protein [Nitrospirales bacterium]